MHHWVSLVSSGLLAVIFAQVRDLLTPIMGLFASTQATSKQFFKMGSYLWVLCWMRCGMGAHV